LTETQDDLHMLQENLDQEMSDLDARTKVEIQKDRAEMQAKILLISKENESFKSEVDLILIL